MPSKRIRDGVSELAYALAVRRATLEATADGIMVLDDEGQITTWNSKFLEMWGISEGLIRSRDIKKIRDHIEYVEGFRRVFSPHRRD